MSNRPVNVFRLDAMLDTFFQESMREFMATQGIKFVDRIQDSDVVVTRFGRTVTAAWRCLHRMRSWRKVEFLIWTDEPRYNTLATNMIKGNRIVPDLHIMNCYTEDIYVSNYYHCGWGMRARADTVKGDTRLLVNRKIVMMAGYTASRKKSSLVIHGKESDLSWLRCNIAAAGKRAGVVDIYGSGWPNGMSIGNSRRGCNWVQQKIDTLKRYRFNLCLENTIYPNYCTEKIWHSILAGCLPIYYGAGTRIYDDFPRDSFLDYSELCSPEALFQKVQSMTLDEYLYRINLCVEVYNRLFESGVWKQTWNAVLKNTIARLRQISGKERVFERDNAWLRV
jgi:alpha(1,3/1,4) fucosyltransferase